MFRKRIAALSAALIMAASMSSAALPAAAVKEDNDSAVVYSAASAVKVSVKFDAAGGTCATKSKIVEYGKTYGTLPRPTRSGYNFTGWYDKAGKKYVSSTKCVNKNAHTLYAHWEKVQKCTLKFNGNGGNVTSSSKSYTGGTIVGALPVARKDGYTFKGWYTQKSGGTRISYNTVLKSVKNRTFYAQYAVPSQATLKYKFDNSYSGFDYDYDYIIPLSIYEYMYNDDDAFWLWLLYGQEWGGNCFGMSSTSAMMNTGKIKIQSFDKKEYFIKDLDLYDRNGTYNLTVSQFIECMQVAQYSDYIQNIISKNTGKYSAFVNQVKACQSGKGKPVVVGISSRYGGHAVLAYKWKKINSTTERVYVYDCNWPDRTSYITLKKRNGNYTGYTFDFGMGNEIADSSVGDSLTYFGFSNIWKAWTSRENTSGYSMLSTNAMNADIYNSEGILCARISDGKLESYDSSVFAAQMFDVESEDMLIYLPDDDYTIVNKDDTELSASLHYGGSTCEVRSRSATVRLSAASEPNVAISADSGDDYKVTIRKGNSEYSVDGYTEVEGTVVVDEYGDDFICEEQPAEEETADAVTELDSSSAAE